MIRLKKGDKVYHKDGFKDCVCTVIAFDNDNLHMSIKGTKIQSPVLIDDYVLTNISLERWKEMTSNEQLEYLKLHPELTRQWVVSWFGSSESGDQCSACERLGAVETLIEHKNPSNGILAETFNKILSGRSYLKTVAILNFWEV
jgi:hypothetical protein